MSNIFQKDFLSAPDTKFKIKLYFNISLSIFLFFLFFSPFGASFKNNNNLILFYSGFGAITFIVIFIFHIILPSSFPKLLKSTSWETEPGNIISFLILSGNAVAFSFYLHYVGRVKADFYNVFKLFLICLIPIIVLKIKYKTVYWKNQAQILSNKLKASSIKEKQGNKEESVTFYSENKSDKIFLSKKNILLLKAADNYVEVNYLDKDNPQKKLLRNTLKNIELQLGDPETFTRCHRTFIVNMKHVKKLSKDYHGHKLILNYYQEEIPVSRHYLLKVKENLNPV